MSRVIGPDKLLQIREALIAGCSIRETARRVGVNNKTVSNYVKPLLHGVDLKTCECGKPLRHSGSCDARVAAALIRCEVKCPCGLPNSHRGWCSHRFARSPKRQAFMRRWHGQPVATGCVDKTPAVPFAPVGSIALDNEICRLSRVGYWDAELAKRLHVEVSYVRGALVRAGLRASAPELD